MEKPMLAHEIIERYLESFVEAPNIWTHYPSSPAWAAEVHRALVIAGLHEFPTPSTEAGYRDAMQRSEHLALDVCIADPSSWGHRASSQRTSPRRVARRSSTPRGSCS
jgi:hypothetical protein